MTFDDLPLYEAVYDVYRMVDNPRSDAWLRPPMCEKVCRQIQAHLPLDTHFKVEQMLQVWSAFGKSVTVETDVKKSELIVLVARTHGRRCFYCGRGKGDCSNEVALDRLLPGSRGGKYTVANCVIACSFHNQQRQDQSVEDYITPSTLPGTF